MRMPHEPHTAMRQLLRYVTDPSTVSFTTSRTSSSVAVSGAVDRELLEAGPASVSGS